MQNATVILQNDQPLMKFILQNALIVLQNAFIVLQNEQCDDYFAKRSGHLIIVLQNAQIILQNALVILQNGQCILQNE